MLEAIIKLTAHDKRYFKDNWNVFDFIIVVGSLVFISLGNFTSIGIGNSASVLRTLRLGRIFKLFR
jgi:hypothetical protein